MKHSTRMFAWEDQVVADRRLRSTPYALHVVVWLRPKIAVSRGWYATHEEIADTLGISVRTVQNAITALVRYGHLRVESGRLKRQPNTYLPPIDVGNRLPTSEAKLATQCGSRRQPVAGHVGNALPTERHLSSSKNSAERRYGKTALTYYESKDNFRRAKAALDASVAADQAGEDDGGEAFQLPPAVGHR